MRVRRPVESKPTRLSAEELGTRTASALRNVATRAKAAINHVLIACRVWAAQAKKGLAEIVDLTSITPESTTPVRHRRTESFQTMQAGTIKTGSSAARASSVGVVERSPAPSPHLLEVSVLESLGFFDPHSAIAVTVDDSQPTLPSPQMVLEQPAARLTANKANQSRSLIPDIDLSGWRPHVIARSKLVGGRLSTTTIIVLSITLVIAVALVAGLLRAPSRQAYQAGNLVSTQAVELTAALTGLDPVLADATTDVAEATPLLIAVDTSARDLFEAAASLGNDPEQAVLRQSATSVAERALDLESLVGDSLSYRLVLNPLWRSPELQGLIDPTQAAAAIATWQAQLGDMVDALPVSQELSTHVEQVRAFVDGIEEWRIDYMNTLATDDLVAAEGAVADLEGQLALLAQSGEETLTTIFTDASAERRRLLADLASISS